MSRVLSGYPAAVLVLLAHFLIAAASVREKSNTFDELVHVTDGYSYWKFNDYRLNPGQGNLPQRWFALPLLAMDLKFPNDQTAWNASVDWAIGNQFFFDSGNDLEKLLWRSRCMNILLSAGLGFLVYAWSRSLFGPGGGMISLLAYALDPTVLANGSLATCDLATAAFFTMSVGCLWKMFHKLSPGTVVGCWLALAGLFLSKMSALLIGPIGVALLIIRLIGRRPLTVAWKTDATIHRRLAQAGILLGALLLQVVLVAVAIWASYGFRYSPFNEPTNNAERSVAGWDETLAGGGPLNVGIGFARDHHLLPEAYLISVAGAYRSAQLRSAFLNGVYSLTGWWYFFPYTFLVKTPLPVFGLIILAAAGAVWSWRQNASDWRHALGQPAWRAFYATAPLWIFLAVYWATVIIAKINIGHRHILPVYPAMFILIGAAGHWFDLRGRLQAMMSAAVAACALILAGECFAMYPDYLAYFNRIAGGPSQGYQHLIDSSLDWGQDLPGLRRWLKRQNLDAPGKTPVYLSYFGTASPAYYHISAAELSGSGPRPFVPLKAGVYCISATNLQRVYANARGRWCEEYERAYQDASRMVQSFATADPASRSQLVQARGEAFWNQTFSQFDDLRLGRLCAFLRHREPDDHIGHSILIYRLTAKDIEDVLVGPPVELDGTPLSAQDFDQLRQHNDKAAEACNNRAWTLATSPDALVRDGAKAVELARRAITLAGEPTPEILDTLAAAYAEMGRFPAAVQTAQQALDMATRQNKNSLADRLRERLKLYQNDFVYRDTPPQESP